MPKSVKILGVKINNLTYKEALTQALKLAQSQVKSYIATPNPEIILEAQQNSEFKKILNNSHLNIPDGTGLLWAANYQTKLEYKTLAGHLITWLYTLLLSIFIRPSTPLKERVTGTDLMEGILKEGAKTGLKIFLLGAAPGVAQKVKEKMEKKYPGIKIVGTSSGSKEIKEESSIIKEIDKSNAEILFVAFGAPHQEMWIARNLPKLKSVRLACGIGGAFDFLSGQAPRAPKLMRDLGLEWLHRLFRQPRRLKRIFNAVIKFPIAVLKNSLKSSKHE